MDTDQQDGLLGRGSLLEGLSASPAAALPRLTLRQRLNGAWDRRAAAWRVWLDAAPGRRTRVRQGAITLAIIAVLGAGAGGYFALRPTPVPDYEKDPFDDVLDFTLLTDDFNGLPIEERLRLLKDLIKRFDSMDGSESELVAGFAAGISGKARKQLEKNASKLVMDVLDREALQYEKAPPEERAKAAEHAFISLYRTMDALDGKDTDKSDQEIVEQGKEEARKGREWIQKQDRQRLGRDTGRMMLSIKDTVASQSSAQERGRMTLMMRDMTRHMRGEPITK